MSRVSALSVSPGRRSLRGLSGLRGPPYLFRMPDRAHPTCQDVREGLTEYLDAALPATGRQGFDDHLAHCSRCRTLLEELRLTLHRLASLPGEPMPEAMKRTLLEELRARDPS